MTDRSRHARKGHARAMARARRPDPQEELQRRLMALLTAGLLLSLLLALAACAPSEEVALAGGPPPTDPPQRVSVPAEGADHAQAAAAALMAFMQRNPQSPGLEGAACVGYVTPAAGPPEVAYDFRDLMSFPQPVFAALAGDRGLWSPIATCRGGPGLEPVSTTGLGGQDRLVYCEGITKVPAGWRMYCGWRGPGQTGTRPEYLVRPTAEPGRWLVARTCEACVRFG